MTDTPPTKTTLLTPEPPPELSLLDELLKTPLYTERSTKIYPNLVSDLLEYDQPFDAYCVGCERHSVFKRASSEYFDGQSVTSKFAIRFDCSRSNQHELSVVFMRTNTTLQKIAQIPSVADLADVDSLKYSKLLGKERLGDFRRAIGLAAHGIGVGSFVYLRRIFEGLIMDAYAVVKAATTWDEDAWQRARMDEKILLLKDQLPEFLVAQRAIYGILSRGVHELSEKECLAHFEVVKAAIEIILDAKLEQQAKVEKQEKVEKLMQAAQQALKK